MAGSGGMEFEVRMGRRSDGGKAEQPETRVTILGDFSGRSGTNAPQAAERRPVDLASLDAVLAGLAPSFISLQSAGMGGDAEVTLTDMDGLSPDALIAQVPACAELVSLIRALDQQDSQANAMAQLAQMAGYDSSQAGKPDASEPSSLASAKEETPDLLGRLLDQGTGSRDRVGDLLKDTIDQALAGQTVPTEAQDVARMRQRAMAMLTATLRAVLRSPGYQRLERNWLGVEWLLQTTENEAVRFELLDLSWDALEASMTGPEPLGESALYRALVEDPARATPDRLLCLYSFGDSLGELAILARLGAIASQSDATLHTHGQLSLCGCPSLEATSTPSDWLADASDGALFWAELRDHPAGQPVQLAAPRFLLRQPYGPKSNPVDHFDFEELPRAPEHEAFCWGNPGLVTLLAALNETRQIDDLPLAVYEDASGQALQPSAEVLLTDTASERIADAGLVALRARRDAGTIML